jgi:hypothetical protein
MAEKSNRKPSKSTQKPKKKVGRPKKRGRKKKYYTPKSKAKKNAIKKGFSSNVTYNRVRSVLWENHKDDFPSYRSFISSKVDENGKRIKGSSIVSVVFNECKSLECNDDDILAIYRQLKQSKKDDNPPIIPDDFYNPQGYWRLITDDYWDGLDERLWVVSPQLLVDPDFFLGILGEDRYVDENNNPIPYNEYIKPNSKGRIVNGKKIRFQEFVNYCNRLQIQKLLEGSENVPHFKFAGLTDDDRNTYWSDVNNRWEVRIVICDSIGDTVDELGDVLDYGFIPSETDQDIDVDLIETIKQRKPETPKTTETPKTELPSETDKKLELKKIEAEIEKSKAEQEKAKAEQEKAKADALRSEKQLKLIDKFVSGDLSKEDLERLLKLIG